MIELLNQYMTEASIGVAILILILPFILKSFFGKTHIAGLVITIGILGTFVGVFIGLLNFDEEKITESVPKLIQGLQTAFATSIAGLISNIILRIAPRLYGFKSETKGAKSDDIGEQIVSTMNKVAHAISGDGESTMVTQLQKLRTTNADGFSAMNESFESFAEKVVADNTQSLIDALTQVMQDFNTQINEQFGDNFKKLNDAVGAMLVWQENYKNHIEDSTKILDQVFKGVQSVNENLRGIDTSLSKTSESHNKIYETNDILKVLMTDFNGQVQSFSEIGTQAKEAFPIIEKRMNELTEAADSFVRSNIEVLKGNYENFAQSQKDTIEQHRSLIEQMITENKDRITKMDEELGNELNRALESLGSHLTTLSKQFVDDYQPLTTKLKEVVEIARNMN